MSLWADSALLAAIRAHNTALDDEEIRKLLHHIVLVERFFLALFQSRQFNVEHEMQPPASLGEMERLFKEAHQDAIDYVARLQESDLPRQIDMPGMQDFRPALRDLLMQVVMHSQHHRAQCAMRLRALGGSPSTTGYIIWVRQRSAAAGV